MRQEHAVVGKLAARDLLELLQKVCDLELRLLFATHIVDDLAFMHHDGTVAEPDGIVHVVCHHEGRKAVLVDKLLREREDLGSRLRVEGCRMLVEQEQLRLPEDCHEKRQRLALAARKQSHLRGHARLKAEVEFPQAVDIAFALGLANAPGKAAVLAPTCSKDKILVDLHVSCCAAHGVLEDASQIGCTLVFGQARDILTAELDRAAIRWEDACDDVQEHRFAGAIAADDRDEIAVCKIEVHAAQSRLLVHRALVEGLCDIRELEHQRSPPFE